jgi:hypothetical protein
VHENDGGVGVSAPAGLDVGPSDLVVSRAGAGTEVWESADRPPPREPDANYVRCGTISRAIAIK